MKGKKCRLRLYTIWDVKNIQWFKCPHVSMSYIKRSSHVFMFSHCLFNSAHLKRSRRYSSSSVKTRGRPYVLLANSRAVRRDGQGEEPITALHQTQKERERNVVAAWQKPPDHLSNVLPLEPTSRPGTIEWCWNHTSSSIQNQLDSARSLERVPASAP